MGAGLCILLLLYDSNGSNDEFKIFKFALLCSTMTLRHSASGGHIYAHLYFCLPWSSLHNLLCNGAFWQA